MRERELSELLRFPKSVKRMSEIVESSSLIFLLSFVVMVRPLISGSVVRTVW